MASPKKSNEWPSVKQEAKPTVLIGEHIPTVVVKARDFEEVE